MQLTSAANLNAVETYVFWDMHEAQPGVYDFSTGRRNLTAFLQAAADANLFVVLRIGPYVCAEWNYGGFPAWLRNLPNVTFRSDDAVWETAMKTFVSRVLLEVQPFLASNGGPIIMAQIENEYGNVEASYGADGKRYMKWAADMALSFDIHIPWIMCAQTDAPSTIVNTRNGEYADDWLAQHFQNFPHQPGVWTENWHGWFQHWREPMPHRPVQDYTFAIARFIARGGTMHNHYVFHGGTNFERTAGGPLIVTSYDYDAPLNEYGWPNEPKYTHVSELHRILDRYGSAIVQNPVARAHPLGPQTEAHVYGDLACTTPNCCVVFLSNLNNATAQSVRFAGRPFTLPAWSVTIVDGPSVTAIFSTADLPSVPPLPLTLAAHPTAEVTADTTGLTPSKTHWLPEPTDVYQANSSAPFPVEQIATTGDTTDYLWYWTNVTVSLAGATRGSVTLQVVAQVPCVHGQVVKKGMRRRNTQAPWGTWLDMPCH